MLPRIVMLPEDKKGNTVVILLEQVIERNIGKLFLSNEVACTCPYRIMRNADLTIDEDEAADLLKEIQKQLKKRQWGEVIRLEVEDKMDERLLEVLTMEFEIKEEDIFQINGPLDLTFLMKMYGMAGFDEYRNKPYTPAPVPAMMTDEDILPRSEEGYSAAPSVYDISASCGFCAPGCKRPGCAGYQADSVPGQRQFTDHCGTGSGSGERQAGHCLVELKARFDEENNIVWQNA